MYWPILKKKCTAFIQYFIHGKNINIYASVLAIAVPKMFVMYFTYKMFIQILEESC